ncbi:MAG TPA: hypothetical protein VG406_09200 [Isosphaeraceae bacterium]|jgi:hypothetical protein|nr:hypothetical protein [Isosphaeraceae bacterium]
MTDDWGASSSIVSWFTTLGGALGRGDGIMIGIARERLAALGQPLVVPTLAAKRREAGS